MIAVLLSLWCYGGNGLSIHNKFRKLGKVPAGTTVKERYYLANHTDSIINIFICKSGLFLYRLFCEFLYSAATR